MGRQIWASVVGFMVTLGAAPAALAGDGTFTSAPDVAVGTRPISVVVGDFNSDGNKDFVTADLLTNPSTVFVRLGAGNGTFTNAPNVGVAFSSRAIAVGDFNSDGNEDLAIACDDVAAINQPDHVFVRLGAGNGTFTNAANVTVGTDPYGVAVGDFNSDGNEDLAVANSRSENVSVHLGAGNGNFASTADAYLVDGSMPTAVAVGDFSSDGIEDLVIANRPGRSVAVRLGAGNGMFIAGADVGVGEGGDSLAVGDFNGDANEDFAATNGFDDNVSVRLGAGNGTFVPVLNVPAGDNPRTVAVGDFDSDGIEDLAIATSAGDLAVRVRLGAGDGSFTDAPNVPASNGPFSVAAADFDSDGNEDLAIAGLLDGPVFVRLGAGAPPLEGNLLQNGGFEGPGAARLFTLSPEIPGWSRTGGMTFARYGIPPNWSTPTHLDSPRYGTGGLNFAWGGNSAATGGITTAFQTVGVAAQAASIDAGLATANLSAYLGGGGIYNDHIKVTADFLDAGGRPLGAFEIGPVTAAQRHNVSTMLPRAGSAPVPAGTRQIRVTLTATDADATYSGGLADNVKLTLDAPTPPPGGTGGPGGAGGPGGSAGPGAFGGKTLVSLSLAAKRIPGKGPVPVRVSNRNAFKVTGSLAGKRKRVKLARKSFRVGANGKATVKLRLPKRLARVLNRKRKLALRMSATLEDPAGNVRTVTRKLSPKLKGRKR